MSVCVCLCRRNRVCRLYLCMFGVSPFTKKNKQKKNVCMYRVVTPFCFFGTFDIFCRTYIFTSQKLQPVQHVSQDTKNISCSIGSV